MLTDRVHALIDDKLYRGCASYAERTPRLNPLPHTNAPAKATHDATHRRTAGIRPQSHLLLTGVMLPYWRRAARHGSAGISLE